MNQPQYIPVQPQKSGCGCLLLPLLFVVMAGICLFIAPQIEPTKSPPAAPSWFVNLQRKIGPVHLPSLPSWFPGSTPTRKGATSTGAPLAFVSTGSDLSVYGPATLTAGQIDTILADHHSPAAGSGADIYADGVRTGIDPAFALAFFEHESTWGTAGMARETHSPGNLKCYDGAACDHGYAAYPSWSAGFAAWYALIAGPVYKGVGLTTVAQIVPKYAPAADHNDVQGYIDAVLASVAAFRAEVHA